MFFLSFSMAYNQAKTHNMLSIMFNPHFQNMKIRQDYVNNFVAIQIVADYDTRIMHPLLLQAYHHLNPNKTPTKLLSIKDNGFSFGHIVSHVNGIL